MSKELMTAEEAAELLGYTRNYLYQLARAGRIPATKAPGKRGRWFFRRDRLLQWVNGGCPPRAEKPSLFEDGESDSTER